MKTDVYRRDYAAYSATLERARYDYRTDAEAEPRLAPLPERFADLWTREAINDLARAHDETPLAYGTERAARAALLRAAQLGFCETRAADVTHELARCQSAHRLDWNNAPLALDSVPDALAVEPDAARRRELSARWLDALADCDDLRAARLNALRDAALSLGFNSFLELRSGDNDGDNDDAARSALETGATDFLDRTERVYMAELHEWSTRQLPPDFARSATYADGLFFNTLAHLDAYFPAKDLRATYDAAMNDLGIRIGRQSNLRVESIESQPIHTRAACCAVRAPEDVRLVFQTDTGGVGIYRDFFAAAGRAQHFAWASPDLAARYPELIYAPDETARAGCAQLFRGLLVDEAWLGAHRHVKPVSAREIARGVALVELYETRRDCARLKHERALAEAPDPRAEQLAAAFAMTLEEATGFRHHPALHLQDAMPAATADMRAMHASHHSLLPPAVDLRARLFAASLNEYLRTRYGHRWWASRKAGDELIDLWNTASRYTVEELASLNGAGALSFDLLADAALTALKRE